jgi:hypothetical protein
MLAETVQEGSEQDLIAAFLTQIQDDIAQTTSIQKPSMNHMEGFSNPRGYMYPPANERSWRLKNLNMTALSSIMTVAGHFCRMSKQVSIPEAIRLPAVNRMGNYTYIICTLI